MRRRAALALLLLGALPLGGAILPAPGGAATTKGDKRMADAVAEGTFDVTMTPSGAADAPIGVMTMAKTFHGALDGTSAGEMLGVRTPTAGSAGYVAMERVTATLAGHHGSFVLQHSGTMNRGAMTATITVVPDSGTDGLAGLTGSMSIDPTGGVHRYRFVYHLPG